MPTLAYGDFDYYALNAEVEAVQDIAAPLTGTGSLIIRRASGSGDTRMNFAPKTPTYSQGVTSGRLRAQFKQVTIGSAATQSYGLLCMQSQRDITGSSGSAYGLRFRANLVELIKVGPGLGTVTTLAASGTIVPGSGINCLQLEWAYQAELDGTALIGYHCAGSDFASLAQVILYQDITSPLITSVTEGGFYRDGSSGLNFDIRVDQMRLQGP